MFLKPLLTDPGYDRMQGRSSQLQFYYHQLSKTYILKSINLQADVNGGTVLAGIGGCTQWKYMRRNRAKSLVLCQPLLYFSSRFSGYFTCMGSFNNYVDKRRGVGGQKMPIYVHVQVKKFHLEVGRCSQNIITSTQLLNDPYVCAHMNLHTTYTTYVLRSDSSIESYATNHSQKSYMHVHVNVHMLTIPEHTKKSLPSDILYQVYVHIFVERLRDDLSFCRVYLSFITFGCTANQVRLPV